MKVVTFFEVERGNWLVLWINSISLETENSPIRFSRLDEVTGLMGNL